MSTITLRCRGPKGQSVVKLAADKDIASLQQALFQATGVAPQQQELLVGFPPRLLQLPLDSSSSVGTLPLSSGENLTVRIAQSAAPAAAAAAAPAPTPPAAGQESAQQQHSWLAADTRLGDGLPALAVRPTTQPNYILPYCDEDEQLARAIAESMEESMPPTQQQAQRAPAVSRNPQSDPALSGAVAASRSSHMPEGAPGSVALPDGSAVMRRIIVSDNSCLFNSVGYVMERSRGQAAKLRRVIAAAVAADPDTYTHDFLEKRNEEYCTWIQDSQHWGGAIELSILARHYRRQIAAYDIQTKREDVYGSDAGFTERVMLIYDGLHYDALALAAFDGAPEELDVTILDPSSAAGEAMQAGAAELVAKAHAARQFTDTGNFTLRCGVCQVGVRGEEQAVEHAKQTGHQSFSEYH